MALNVQAARVAALLACLGAPGAGGCAGERPAVEAGEACWDGKDNDGDQQVDCADQDCAEVAFCTSVHDGGADRGGRKDGKAAGDRGRTPDRSPPQSDRPSSTSYGSRCTFSGSIAPCGDGTSRCIPGKYSGGFCSQPCTTLYATCPAGPAGTFAACLYTVNGVNYCAFLCEYLDVPYNCPVGLSCSMVSSSQGFCWP